MMNYVIYVILFVALLTVAVVSYFRILRLKSSILKAFLGGLVGGFFFSGDFLLMGRFLQNETLREHYVFPDVLALSACFVAGAIAGILLPFVQKKKES